MVGILRIVYSSVDADALCSRLQWTCVTECWLWADGRNAQGYALFSPGIHSCGSQLAHRFSHVRFNGPVKAGKQVDHVCRRRDCVNPRHLRAISARTNILLSDGVAARNAKKTRCGKCEGWLHARSDGSRYCPPCRRSYMRAYNRARREQLQSPYLPGNYGIG